MPKQAQVFMAQYQVAEQVRQAEAATQRQHLATLKPVAQWLHTRLGAIVTLAISFVGFGTVITYASAGLNPPILIAALTDVIFIGLPIALSIIDWRDYSSFHGAIPWNVWRAEGKNGRWWTLAIVLLFYGGLFMPVVFAIQAWTRAGEVKNASRAALDAKIAALEAEVLPQPPSPPKPVLPPPPVIPPPPPPLPITRRYDSDEDYNQGAASLVNEGWVVSKVSRDKDNHIVVAFIHRTDPASNSGQRNS